MRQAETEVVVVSHVLGVETDRLVEIRDGLVVFFLFVECPAATSVGQAEFRIETDRLVVVGDRLVVRVVGEPDLAAVVVGQGEFRVETDGLVIVGQCNVLLVLILQDPAATDIGRDVRRFGPDRAREVVDGLVVGYQPIGRDPAGHAAIFVFDPERRALDPFHEEDPAGHSQAGLGVVVNDRRLGAQPRPELRDHAIADPVVAGLAPTPPRGGRHDGHADQQLQDQPASPVPALAQGHRHAPDRSRSLMCARG